MADSSRHSFSLLDPVLDPQDLGIIRSRKIVQIMNFKDF